MKYLKLMVFTILVFSVSFSKDLKKEHILEISPDKVIIKISPDYNISNNIIELLKIHKKIKKNKSKFVTVFSSGEKTEIVKGVDLYDTIFSIESKTEDDQEIYKILFNGVSLDFLEEDYINLVTNNFIVENNKEKLNILNIEFEEDITKNYWVTAKITVNRIIYKKEILEKISTIVFPMLDTFKVERKQIQIMFKNKNINDDAIIAFIQKQKNKEIKIYQNSNKKINMHTLIK